MLTGLEGGELNRIYLVLILPGRLSWIFTSAGGHMRVLGWSCLTLAVVVVTIAADQHSQGVLLAGILLGPAAVWLMFRRRFNTPFLSPATIVAGVIYLIGTFGYVARDALATTDGAGASINIWLSEKESYQTLCLMNGFATIIVVVAGLFLLRRRHQQRPIKQTHWMPRPLPGWVFPAAIVPAILVIADNGSELILRQDYLFIKSGSILGSLSSPLLVGSVLICGYIFGSARGPGRLVALAIVLLDSAIFMSFGSRQFALVPVLFAVGVLVAKNTRGSKFGVLVAAAASFLLLPFPLRFRGALTHGLAPHADIFFAGYGPDVNWLSTLNNVLVSFDITGATMSVGVVSWSDIAISLNPLPGAMAGWYEISGLMRLNPVTPYGAIGQLGAVGVWSVILVSIPIGLILAWLEHVVQDGIDRGSHIFAAAVIGLVSLFALNLAQYPLRSASRMLLYAVALEIARRLLTKIKMRPHPAPSARLRMTTRREAREVGRR